MNYGLDPSWMTWALDNCINPTFKYYKQGFYFGELLNDLRHGKGVLLYMRRSLYAGEWQNDKKHGLGNEIFSNGNKFEGSYVNGKPEGFGIFTSLSESYEG